MKSLGIIAFATAVLLPLAGCEWLRTHMSKDPSPPRGTGQLEVKKPEQFVAFLNERATRFQSITYAGVRVTASDHGIPSPPLSGDLFATQPRNFCLVASGGLVGAKVILGSNDQQFWVYAKVPTADPMYVYASHTDFAEGRAKTGGIPFEPEWVMQTLGMVILPPADDQVGVPPGTQTNHYSVKIDDKSRTYILSWPAVAPNGTPKGVAVVKEIVFEGDQEIGNRPRVKKHVVRDAASGKIICFAEIKTAKAWPPAPDARTTSKSTAPDARPTSSGADARNNTPTVQYPTKVMLRWEEQKFEMDLEVLKAKINQPLDAEEARRRYTRPNIAGSNPVNLAVGEVPLFK